MSLLMNILTRRNKVWINWIQRFLYTVNIRFFIIPYQMLVRKRINNNKVKIWIYNLMMTFYMKRKKYTTFNYYGWCISKNKINTRSWVWHNISWFINNLIKIHDLNCDNCDIFKIWTDIDYLLYIHTPPL